MRQGDYGAQAYAKNGRAGQARRAAEQGTRLPSSARVETRGYEKQQEQGAEVEMERA